MEEIFNTIDIIVNHKLNITEYVYTQDCLISGVTDSPFLYKISFGGQEFDAYAPLGERYTINQGIVVLFTDYSKLTKKIILFEKKSAIDYTKTIKSKMTFTKDLQIYDSDNTNFYPSINFGDTNASNLYIQASINAYAQGTTLNGLVIESSTDTGLTSLYINQADLDHKILTSLDTYNNYIAVGDTRGVGVSLGNLEVINYLQFTNGASGSIGSSNGTKILFSNGIDYNTAIGIEPAQYGLSGNMWFSVDESYADESKFSWYSGPSLIMELSSNKLDLNNIRDLNAYHTYAHFSQLSTSGDIYMRAPVYDNYRSGINFSTNSPNGTYDNDAGSSLRLIIDGQTNELVLENANQETLIDIPNLQITEGSNIIILPDDSFLSQLVIGQYIQDPTGDTFLNPADFVTLVSIDGLNLTISHKAISSGITDLYFSLNPGYLDANSPNYNPTLPNAIITKRYVDDKIKNINYGSFFSETTQTALVANTPYTIDFEYQDSSNGIYTVEGSESELYVESSGIYNIQFSLQLESSFNQIRNASIWLRKNGDDIDDTAGYLTIDGKSVKVVASWNYILNLEADDYIELVWSADHNDVSLVFIPASESIPNCPSAIITIQQLSYVGSNIQYTAGDGINIDGNTISSTGGGGGSTYYAGTGLTLNGVTFSNTGVITVSGTANQVNVSGVDNIILSLPQSIATTSNVTFGRIFANSGVSTNSISPLATGDLIINSIPFGYRSGNISTNIGIGSNVLSANTTGYQLIGIGQGALNLNTASRGNVAIGVSTLAATIDGNYNVAVGDNSLILNTYGYHNTAIGASSLSSLNGGSANGNSRRRNTAIGHLAGSNLVGANAAGNYNLLLGYNSQTTSTTSNGEGVVGDANLISFRPGAHNTTDLGAIIGGVTYSWKNVYTQNAVTVTSDERTKTDIQPSSLGLNFINDLNPVSYKFKVGSNKVELDEDGNDKIIQIPGERVHFGLIAQQVKTALPEDQDFGGWVLADKDDPDSSQFLRYEEFISPMIKAIQELAQEVNTLKNRISELENK
jgi:hypothetical protein